MYVCVIDVGVYSENGSRGIKMSDTRERKIISFTNEYKHEMRLLTQEDNASNLVCKLLRKHYKGGYNMEKLEEDMEHIKEVLDKVLKGLGDKS